MVVCTQYDCWECLPEKYKCILQPKHANIVTDGQTSGENKEYMKWKTDKVVRQQDETSPRDTEKRI